MIGHAYDGLPDEACGLLAGPAGGGRAVRFYPCTNADASSRTYTVDPRDHLRADRAAEADGLEIVGVVHSHTHTDAYPSPTDVDQAANPLLPTRRWVVVSLRPPTPSARSYLIDGGSITEEPLEVLPR